VLGAGGSARAAVWALREAGASEVAIWNRTPARARAVGRDLGARVLDEPAPADLLINCTSVGLEHGVSEHDSLRQLGLTYERVGDYPEVVDMVYHSGGTSLLAAAAAHGARTLDGLEILLAQGAISFELWTGEAAPLEAMRSALRDPQSPEV
jgi:shikimate dehydrogenase